MSSGSSRPPYYRHVGRGMHPKDHLPTNASTRIRPLPPPPRNKDSSSGLPDPQGPNVTARLRNFEHHMPLKHDVKYTYAENPSSPNVVYFFEYRGHGAPSHTFGVLGDTYLDLTGDSHAVYAKGRVGWTRWWVSGGWIEHPFLTDTVLWVDKDAIIWEHPTSVNKPSRDADISYAIQGVLAHELMESLLNTQALPKQPEIDDRNDVDAVAAGNRSRKRPRVDEESSSTAHNSKRPSSPISVKQSVQMGGDHSTSPEISSSISQAGHSSARQPHNGNMDSRISGLQQEITKLQQDLRDIQAENARVTSRNKQLETEVETLNGINKKLKEERAGTKGKTGDAPRASDVGVGRGQSGPDGFMPKPTERFGKNILGRFAQPPSAGSDADDPKADDIPADLRKRLEGHANNFTSLIDEVIGAHTSLQGALKTIADQKRQNATLSAEVQKLQDARTQLEIEHTEDEKRLQAMHAWLKGVPKFDQDMMRRGG